MRLIVPSTLRDSARLFKVEQLAHMKKQIVKHDKYFKWSDVKDELTEFLMSLEMEDFRAYLTDVGKWEELFGKFFDRNTKTPCIVSHVLRHRDT